MPPWFIFDIKGQRLQDELESEDDRQNPDHHRPSAGEYLQADRLYPMVHGPYHTEAQSGEAGHKKQRDNVKIPHEITHENAVHRPPDQPWGKVCDHSQGVQRTGLMAIGRQHGNILQDCLSKVGFAEQADLKKIPVLKTVKGHATQYTGSDCYVAIAGIEHMPIAGGHLG